VVSWTVVLLAFLGAGFFVPKAISAISKKRLLCGAPPGRLSQARSPFVPLREKRGEIHSSFSGAALFLVVGFFLDIF